MNGLLLAEDNSDRARSPLFAECFAPVLNNLAPFFWFATNYDGGPFDSLAHEYFDDDFLESLFVDLPNEVKYSEIFALLRPGFFPALANYFYNDNIELIGISGDEAAAIKVAERFLELHLETQKRHCNIEQQRKSHNRNVKLIESTAEICFYNIDTRSWEIYAKDDEIINSVEKHLKTLTGLHSQRLKLSERDEVLGFWR